MVKPLASLTQKYPILFVLACLSGAGFAYVLIGLIALIIIGGGWGTLIAFKVYGPIALLLGIVTLFLILLYRSKSHLSIRPILIISVLAGGIIYGASLLIVEIDYGTRERDFAIGNNMITMHDTIDDYYTSHNKTLPASDAIVMNDKNITYRIVDQEKAIYELCSTFEVDTTKDYSPETAQKIATGQVVALSDDYQVFYTHPAAKQCYKLQQEL